jgi:hypothetical protein
MHSKLWSLSMPTVGESTDQQDKKSEQVASRVDSLQDGRKEPMTYPFKHQHSALKIDGILWEGYEDRQGFGSVHGWEKLLHDGY